MKHIITLFFLGFVLIAQAQVEKTIHQIFEIDENAPSIALDIVNEFEVENWASNTIMAVTTVKLESGAQHLLDFYLREGRYDIEALGEKSGMILVSKNKTRQRMKYRGHLVYEIVNVKLFVPNDYELSENNTLVKKEVKEIKEDTASANQ